MISFWKYVCDWLIYQQCMSEFVFDFLRQALQPSSFFIEFTFSIPIIKKLHFYYCYKEIFSSQDALQRKLNISLGKYKNIMGQDLSQSPSKLYNQIFIHLKILLILLICMIDCYFVLFILYTYTSRDMKVVSLSFYFFYEQNECD